MKDGLVIGVIEEIHQNSIYVKLLDSDKKGFINVSNIPGLWIRELKKKFKAGQLIVAKIIKEDGILELSLKGVSKYDKEKKLQEYRKEQKALKNFERICREYKIKESKIREIIQKLKNEYGSLDDAISKIRRGEEILNREFEMVVDRLCTGEKIYELKGTLELHSYDGCGIEHIIESLNLLKNIDISYVGNTKFLLKFRTKNPKEGNKIFKNEVEKAIKKITCYGGEGKFSFIE